MNLNENGYDDNSDGIIPYFKPLPEEIEYYQKMIEEMANTPKEPLGTRSPGETCAYERNK